MLLSNNPVRSTHTQGNTKCGESPGLIPASAALVQQHGTWYLYKEQY
jgi:hypothetical protein